MSVSWTQENFLILNGDFKAESCHLENWRNAIFETWFPSFNLVQGKIEFITVNEKKTDHGVL